MRKELIKIAEKIPYFRAKLYARRKWVTLEETQDILEKANVVKIELNGRKPYVGIVKDMKNIDADVINARASWLRYERLLKNNDIPYDFYDIENSDWIEQAKKFDIIVWHTNSSPEIQAMAESKIHLIENKLGKSCFPSYNELWWYENKTRANYLYELYNLPTIPSFATNSYSEALEYIRNCEYPLISKIDTAAGSRGVEKINSYKQAKSLVDSVFSYRGIKTCWPFIRHKGYIYFQKFIDDATFDLRIFIVDNKAFGYYRYPNKGDFRASGAGNVEKKSIPNDAIKIASNVAKKLDTRLVGVDLLYSKKHSQYFIIESSVFNQIDTPEQLVIDGVPGYYDISDLDNIHFVEGRYWIQELSIKTVVEGWSKLNK